MRWFGITLLIIMLVSCSAFAQSDYPEWPAYTFDDPMTAALEPTGPDLHWSSAQPVGTTRLFLSNHPESIDASVPEGKLWTEEVSTSAETTYRLFLQHYNNYPLSKKLFIGVTVENLSHGGDLTISGEYISTPYQSADNTRAAWTRLKEVGKRNAFAELKWKITYDTPCCDSQEGWW